MKLMSKIDITRTIQLHRERMGYRWRTTFVVWGFTVTVFLMIEQGSAYGLLTAYEDIAVRAFQFILLGGSLAYSFMPSKGYLFADIAVRFIGGPLLLGGLIFGAFNEPNNLSHYLVWLVPYQLFAVYVSSTKAAIRLMLTFLICESTIIVAALIAGTMTFSGAKFTLFLSMITAQVLTTVVLMALVHYFKKSETAKARAQNLLATANILEESVRDAEEARAEALAANHTKSNFLAMMSHELRTPLNAIIGFSEILKSQERHGLTTDKTQEYAKDIHDSANHLLSLINDVLDLAKIEAGKLERQDEAFDLAWLLEDCLRLIGPLSLHHNIKVNLETTHPLNLYADPRLIKQVIVNLISNAIKYGKRGGSVEIRYTGTSEAGLTLSIKDDGNGMDQETVKRVLEPFERGSNNTHQSSGDGTGLGLAIVQSLTELHGGRLILDSAIGKGTVATIHLPAECVKMHAKTPHLAPLVS